MNKYPYDKRVNDQLETSTMKAMFNASSHLMFMYEPFGQASSSYETGDPEMVALGLRTFLSIPENLQMLRDIGKQTFENLVVLGKVAERYKRQKDTSEDSIRIQKQWEDIKKSLNHTDERTLNAILSELKPKTKCAICGKEAERVYPNILWGNVCEKCNKRDPIEIREEMDKKLDDEIEQRMEEEQEKRLKGK